MLTVGLTGSIGMGKSTTASMFAELGVPVHDADVVVHDLYSDPDTVAAVDAAFPGVAAAGSIDRTKLSQRVIGKPDAMKRLEAIVHPRVHKRQNAFLKKARQDKASYAILDIPLLFETGGDKQCDKIVVVSADAETQQDRVLSRAGMTQQRFEAINDKQMPDEEKRARADFVVETDRGFEAARARVKQIHDKLMAASPI